MFLPLASQYISMPPSLQQCQRSRRISPVTCNHLVSCNRYLLGVCSTHRNAIYQSMEVVNCHHLQVILSLSTMFCDHHHTHTITYTASIKAINIAALFIVEASPDELSGICHSFSVLPTAPSFNIAIRRYKASIRMQLTIRTCSRCCPQIRIMSLRRKHGTRKR